MSASEKSGPTAAGSAKVGGGTPAMVALAAAGVPFVAHEFHHDPGERNFGAAAASALGVEPHRVFKTLLVQLTVDGRLEHVVGIVPVSAQLSLRALAAVMGGKRAEMCPPDVAERLTGSVVGGISPFGQKRRLRTAIDETCILFDTVFVSGGKRGLDIEVAPGRVGARARRHHGRDRRGALTNPDRPERRRRSQPRLTRPRSDRNARVNDTAPNPPTAARPLRMVPHSHPSCSSARIAASK